MCMRWATKEELESVDRYIKSISKPTEINFFAILENGSTIQSIEPKQPVKHGQRAKIYPVDDLMENINMSNYLEQYSKEQIQENLETMLALEFLGIHIEDTKNLKDEIGLESIVAYFFSVPEFSIIDVDGNEINEKIKSADGLISVAKESLTEMVEHSLKDISKDDIYLEEIIEDFKSDVSKFIKFYAKVRKGETWDKEMGRKAVEKISSDIKRATGYKEV